MQAREVRERIRALGCTFTSETIQQSMALYAGLLRAVPPAATRVERDLAYGPDPRHRLDVFHPAAGAGAAPILLFVHGGGFVGGDKGAPEAPFYNNLGRWAAGQGMLGVTMTYRLAPAHPWPAGAQDIALALRFVRGAAPGWGADPDGVFLMGQSAGAVHVASYLARPELQVGPGAGLAGALLISCLYDLTRAERNAFLKAYFGDDPARYAERSSIEGLLATPVPLLCSISEFDVADFMQQAVLLQQRWLAARGTLPRLLYLSNHNHISSVLQIGTPFDTLGPEIRAFVEDHAPR